MTGIRTIEDIRQRRVIDEGGCWLWSGAMRSQAAGRGHTPMLHLPRGVLGERAVIKPISASRHRPIACSSCSTAMRCSSSRVRTLICRLGSISG